MIDDESTDDATPAAASSPRLRPLVVAALVAALLMVSAVVGGGAWLMTRHGGAHISDDALCAQDHVVTRELFIAMGDTTAARDTLVRSFTEVIRSPSFAGELAPRLSADSASRSSSEEVADMITATARPDDSTIEVAVRSSDLAAAERVSEQVLPTLLDVIDDGQRGLPPADRLHGPPPQEVMVQPVLSTVCRDATAVRDQ